MFGLEAKTFLSKNNLFRFFCVRSAKHGVGFLLFRLDTLLLKRPTHFVESDKGKPNASLGRKVIGPLLVDCQTTEET